MQCESRSVRTVTTKYTDSEGKVKSKRRAELSGKSVLYEGEYSETDSEPESENGPQKSNGAAAKSKQPLIKNLGTLNLNDIAKGTASMSLSSSLSSSSKEPVKIGLDSIRIGNHKPFTDDTSMFKRQKLLNIPNIELKPVKVTEFNESFDEDSDDNNNDEDVKDNYYDNINSLNNKSSSSSSSSRPGSSSSAKLSQAEMQAKINNHLSINLNNGQSNGTNGRNGTTDPTQKVISDETKEDEKSDVKVIDSTDEKTGLAIRTSIENKMKTNENIKVCKGDERVDVQETDDAIIKKITTKTKTTKSIIKTTTTTTTKKGTVD